MPTQQRESIPVGFYIDAGVRTPMEGDAAVIELAAGWVSYDPGENVPGLVAAIRALDTAGDKDAAGHFADLLREIADEAVSAINATNVLEPNTYADWNGDAGGFGVWPINCDVHEYNPDHGACSNPDACYVATNAGRVNL